MIQKYEKHFEFLFYKSIVCRRLLFGPHTQEFRFTVFDEEECTLTFEF